MSFHQPTSGAEFYTTQNAPQQNMPVDDYEDILCERDQPSNTEAAQETEYVNAMVAKKVEGETKRHKNWNKTLILAITTLVMVVIMMVVFIGLFIKLSNEQTEAITGMNQAITAMNQGITAMNQTMFKLAKENTQLLQAQKYQLQLHINDFQNETFHLRSNDEDLNNKTRDLAQGYEELENGWITPFNGFQYKYNTSGHNWNNARTFCNGMGGDLASLGIWDMEIRRILKKALNINSTAWIGLNGLNGINSQRIWYWVTSYGSNSGYRASAATAMWYPGQPTRSSSYYCAYLGSSDLLAAAQTCGVHYHVLCEKTI